MTESTCTIHVCVDCMFVHANGETEGTPDREPWNLLEREPEGSHVTMGLVREEHACGYESDKDSDAWESCECEEDSFSWSACEGCGSRLGGSRHAFTLWTPDAPDAESCVACDSACPHPAGYSDGLGISCADVGPVCQPCMIESCDRGIS